MAPKKPTAPTSTKPTTAPASNSKLAKGTGSRRITNRIITIYGPPKSRKTGSVSTLPLGRTKWLVSDPNAVPTLTILDRLPHPDDLYELKNLEHLRQTLEEWNKVGEDAVDAGYDAREALGIDYIVNDSWTQWFDWHQQDTAKATSQRYVGENSTDNGWQRFNAEFGACLDLWASLGRFVTCVSILHSKPKFDASKGEYASFSLSPEMARKLGRLSNWILLKGFNELLDDGAIAKALDAIKNDPDGEGAYYVTEENRGVTKVFEEVFYTKPTSGFIASVNSLKLKAEEPGSSLMRLLERDGLV